MNPSCTRFRQKAKCPFSDGGDAMEYARVISSPSGVAAFTESHCPGTKPKRAPPLTSSSRCLVNSESGTERSRRASNVLNWAIIHVDDFGEASDASLRVHPPCLLSLTFKEESSGTPHLPLVAGLRTGQSVAPLVRGPGCGREALCSGRNDRPRTRPGHGILHAGDGPPRGCKRPSDCGRCSAAYDRGIETATGESRIARTHRCAPRVPR